MPLRSLRAPRSNRLLRRPCIALAALVVWPLLCGAEAPSEGIYYKLGNLTREGLRPESVSLANASPEIQFRLLPNETLADALERHCVGPDAAYLSLAREALPRLNATTPATAIHILVEGLPNPEPGLLLHVPFCVSVRFEELRLEPHASISSIFRRSQRRAVDSVSAEAAEDWKWRFLAANRFLSPAAFAAYERLKRAGSLFEQVGQQARDDAIAAVLQSAQGKIIAVPTGTIDLVEVITPANQKQIPEIKNILGRLRLFVLDIKDLNQGSWGRPVAHERHLSNLEACGKPPDGPRTAWPITGLDPHAIKSILAINDRVRTKEKEIRGTSNPTISPTIVIADNGLLNATEPPFKGIVWNEPNRPANPHNLLFNHGTLVASVAIGGPSLAFELSDVTKNPVRLLISNIEDGGFVGDRAFTTMVSLVRETLIVNLSLRFPLPIQEFEDLARVQKASNLFVAAAGNIQRLGWPAGYGGRDTGNIITVAALAPWGKIAQDTYQDAHDVDIGALGCDVPVLNLVETLQTPPADLTAPPGRIKNEYLPDVGSGTSFAAPQVSFVAALLKREHHLLNAAQLRRRILVASDIRPDLEQAIRDGRVLNAPKTLSLFLDVVQRKSDGKLLFGKVTLPGIRQETTHQVNLCGKDWTVRSIRRIARRIGATDGRTFLVYRENDRVPAPELDRLRLDFCHRLAGSIRFEEFEGPQLDLAFDEINDIIMAEPSIAYYR